MQIVKVTAYGDRGLLRSRIQWVDGPDQGIADTRCAITGVPLGPNHTLCVRHCRFYGHYSKDVNDHLGMMLRGDIQREDWEDFIKRTTLYPDDMDESESA